MSFLKSEDEKTNQSFVSKGDIITLLVIALLGTGGYFYFKKAKADSLAAVVQAQEVYESGDYVKALYAFRDLEKLSWKNDSLDSVIYATQSLLEDRRSNQKFVFDEIEERLEKGDSASLEMLLNKFVGTEFLSKNQLDKIQVWKERIAEKATVADSSAAEK